MPRSTARPHAVSNQLQVVPSGGRLRNASLHDLLGKLVITEEHYLLLETMLQLGVSSGYRPLAEQAVGMLVDKLRAARGTAEQAAIMGNAKTIMDGTSLFDGLCEKMLGGVPWRALHVAAHATSGAVGTRVMGVMQVASALLPAIMRSSWPDVRAAVSAPMLMSLVPTMRGHAQFEQLVEAFPASIREGLAHLQESIERVDQALGPNTPVQAGLLSLLVVLWHVYRQVEDRPMHVPRHGLEGLIARLPDHWHQLVGWNRVAGRLTRWPALYPGQQRFEHARDAARQVMRNTPEPAVVRDSSNALRQMIDECRALISAWRYNAGKVELDDLDVGSHRKDLVVYPDMRSDSDQTEWHRQFNDAALVLERMRKEADDSPHRTAQVDRYQGWLIALAERVGGITPEIRAPEGEWPAHALPAAPQRLAEGGVIDIVADAQRWMMRVFSRWSFGLSESTHALHRVANTADPMATSAAIARSPSSGESMRALMEPGMPEALAVRGLGPLAAQFGPSTSGVAAASVVATPATLPTYWKKVETRTVAYFLAWRQVADELPNLQKAANATMHALIKKTFGMDINPENAFYCEFKTAQSSHDTVTGWEHHQPPDKAMSLARIPIANFVALQYMGPDNDEVDAGIYTTANGTRFDHANEIRIKPEELIEAFGAVDFLTQFKASLDVYRREHAQDLLDFVVYRTLYDLARHTGERQGHDATAQLQSNIIQAALGYEQALVALGGASVSVSTFDINGYAATNMYVVSSGRNVVLVAPTTSERMMFFRSMEALRQWVIDKAHGSGVHATEIEDAFSLRNRQDGIVYSGIDRWADVFFRSMSRQEAASYICISPQAIADWPRYMADAMMQRLADDAEFLVVSQAHISDELWEAYLGSVDELMPMLQPIALPLQIGVHVHELVDAGNSGQRRHAVYGLASDALNLVLLGAQSAFEGKLKLDIAEPFAFRFDATNREWKLASPNFPDQLPLDDMIKDLDLLHRVTMKQGRFVPSVTPGVPGEFIDGMGARMPAIEVDGQYFLVTYQPSLGDYVVSARHCRWGAVARFRDGKWELTAPLLQSHQGIWTFDGFHPKAHEFTQLGTLEKVNGYDDVPVTLSDGQAFLSDVPGGGRKSQALHPISAEAWGIVIPAQELPVDWSDAPGVAEQRWLAQARVDSIDPAHLHPDADRRIYTDIEEQRWVALDNGFLPVTKRGDGSLYVEGGGPAVFFATDGSFRLQLSTRMYEAPIATLDDLYELAEAMGVAGLSPNGSKGLSLLTAMRRVGYRGSPAQLAEWIKLPRTLPLEIVEGPTLVIEGASAAQATDALLMRNNLANFDQLTATLPDDDVISAVLEDTVARKLIVACVVPYRHLRNPQMAHQQVIASPADEVSLFQVLADVAARRQWRIRQVAASSPPSLADFAMVYCDSPDAVIVAPERPALTPPGRWRTLDTSRQFELDATACATRPERAPGCATWHTVIDDTALSRQARKTQALNHQILTSDAQSGLLAHDHRLYRTDREQRKLALLPPEAYGSIARPLVALPEVDGQIRVAEGFGMARGSAPLDLNIHTRVVSLGPIIEGVADSRILRATYHVTHSWDTSRQILVVEPMPGLFYRCDVSRLWRQHMLDGLAHVPLRFQRLDVGNPENWKFIAMHVDRWDRLQGEKGGPLATRLTRLPETSELRDLMASKGYRQDQIDEFFYRYRSSLASRVFRTRLLRRIKEQNVLSKNQASLPIPAVTLRPAPAGSTPAQVNAHNAQEALNVVTSHFQVTGLGSMNKRLGAEEARRLQARPAVIFLQGKGCCSYPDYPDLVLRMGAGNCGEMAAAAERLIENAGGQAQIWHLSDIHAFTLVGEIPATVITGDFSGSEWSDLQVADPWIGWSGKASDYRENFMRIMHRWDMQGRTIFFEKRGHDVGDWYSPVDAEWLERAAEPFNRAFIPEAAPEGEQEAAQAVLPVPELIPPQAPGDFPEANAGAGAQGGMPALVVMPSAIPQDTKPGEPRGRDPEANPMYPWLRE